MSTDRSLKQVRSSGRRQGRIRAFISPRVILAKARKAARRQKRLAEETAEARKKGITLNELRKRRHQEAEEIRTKSRTGSYGSVTKSFPYRHR